MSDAAYLHTEAPSSTLRYRVRVYRRDVRLTPQRRIVGPRPGADTAPRGSVTRFSRASVERFAFVAANAPDVGLCSMLTLTYHPDAAPGDGRTVKRHLNAALQRARRLALPPRNPVPCALQYVWFLEFTLAGVPHLHLLLNLPIPSPAVFVRRGSLQNVEATREWCRWWTVETGAKGEVARKMALASASWERLRKSDGAVRYCLKYGASLKQKTVPEGFQDVGRFWGHSRAMRPVPVFDGVVSCVTVARARWAGRGDEPFRVQYGAADRFTTSAVDRFLPSDKNASFATE